MFKKLLHQVNLVPWVLLCVVQITEESCLMSTGEHVPCISLYQCGPLLNAAASRHSIEAVEFVRQYQCGHGLPHTEPLVCCSSASPINRPPVAFQHEPQLSRLLVHSQRAPHVSKHTVENQYSDFHAKSIITNEYPAYKERQTVIHEVPAFKTKYTLINEVFHNESLPDANNYGSSPSSIFTNNDLNPAIASKSMSSTNVFYDPNKTPAGTTSNGYDFNAQNVKTEQELYYEKFNKLLQSLALTEESRRKLLNSLLSKTDGYQDGEDKLGDTSIPLVGPPGAGFSQGGGPGRPQQGGTVVNLGTGDMYSGNQPQGTSPLGGAGQFSADYNPLGGGPSFSPAGPAGPPRRPSPVTIKKTNAGSNNSPPVIYNQPSVQPSVDSQPFNIPPPRPPTNSQAPGAPPTQPSTDSQPQTVGLLPARPPTDSQPPGAPPTQPPAVSRPTPRRPTPQPTVRPTTQTAITEMPTMRPRADLLPTKRLCGMQHTDDRNFNQSLTALDEFPWLALLKYFVLISQMRSLVTYACTGSIINNRYVLTTAGCLTQPNWHLLGIRLGEYDPRELMDCQTENPSVPDCNDPAVDVDFDRIIIHPNFNQRTYENDIGLIRLKKIIEYTEYVRPICLPYPMDVLTNPGDVLTTSGWGDFTVGANVCVLRPSKKRNSPSLISNGDCQRLWREDYENHEVIITDTNLCVRENTSNKSQRTCLCDTGGPLMYRFQNNWYQLGLVSFGPIRNFTLQCTNEIAQVHVRVSSYIQWILTTILP